MQVTQGQKINIKFVNVTLQEDSDRLEIYNGDDQWTPYVTFNKELQPRDVTSSGHFVRIITNGFVVINYTETCKPKLYFNLFILRSPKYFLNILIMNFGSAFS